MKTSLFLLTVVSLFSHSEAQACVPGKLIYVDSHATGRPDGTAARPYSTITMAFNSIKARDYCTVDLFLKKGTYAETVSFDRPATVKGESRTETIIDKSGLWSMVAADLTLWDMTFKNTPGRAILKKSGTIHLNRITVDSYRFVENMFIPTPTAVQLINVQGNITGLDFYNSDQPVLRITGINSNLSILGLVTSNTKFLGNYESADKLNYISAVEVTEGAKAKINGLKITNAESVGLLINNATSKITFSEIHNTTKATSSRGNDFVFINGSHVQGNFLTSTGAELAGLMILMGSTFYGDNIALKSNRYGAVYSLDDAPKDYKVEACFLSRPNVVISGNNEKDIYNVSMNLPVPNEPLPVPCLPGNPCPTPTPTPTPPPVNCYPVNL